MAKATLTLPNGTVVGLEGTPEEVHRLLEVYSGGAAPPAPATRNRHEVGRRARKRVRRATQPSATAQSEEEKEGADLNGIVNLVKNCDDADGIESNVLDRASQVDRTLLPLYIVHEELGNKFGLTSGEISKITTELGVRVTQPNASRTLSGVASRYVMGDKVRKKGQPVRYRLSRRGVQYMKDVIRGKGDQGDD